MTRKNQILFVVAFSETIFSIYYMYLAHLISRPAPYGPGDLREIQAAFTRVLKSGLANLPEDDEDEGLRRPGSPEEDIIQLEFDDPRAVDFRNALRPWFNNAPWSSIKLHEIRQWLYWSIYNADLPAYESLLASEETAVETALQLLQKRCGCSFKEGSNPDISTMRMTLDKVHILCRPLTFYLIIHSINTGLRKWYETRWNARYGNYNGLEYLLCLPKHWDSVTGPRPVIFIHGLGLGLLQYNSVLRHMFKQFSDRPLLIILQPQISQHIFHPRYLKPMTRQETSDRLARLIASLGWVNYNIHDEKVASDDSGEEKGDSPLRARRCSRGVTMLSHSNGSYTHAWMLKGHPKLIARSCFIDPVTFCSWEGDVCYNFLYRQPKTGIELLMRYFVATEVGVTNLVQRHFDWASNTLYFEEIPNACDPSKSLFLLGGEDSIVHSERVKRYLTSHGVKQGLCYDPQGLHGQVLFPGSRGHHKILRWVHDESSTDPTPL
ncbi:hypothetical protein H0H81_011727 [Sphagnurus paluster]|uniref:Uncharacterized protein n=1 Tax=Sphagnurus paluster TaxID=117069 RepID=A0A9P7GIC3_9AGAR|nr:hypothetical protein H0H81_011727 [Sphagnurus paluster]